MIIKASLCGFLFLSFFSSFFFLVYILKSWTRPDALYKLQDDLN